MNKESLTRAGQILLGCLLACRNKALERVSTYDRATGRLLWQQEWTGAMKVPFFAASNSSRIRSTPACDGETLFVGGMRDLLVALDVQTGAVRWQVDFVERMKSDVPAFGFVCSPLLVGYMSSPVVIGDHLYLLLKNQRFACFDLRTGEEKWRRRPDGKYWSCLAQGDRILALDARGVLLLLRANPAEFEVLSERRISDAPTWAHLAAAGQELFVRELQALVAYRWQ